jgi:hypothetical protein
MEKSIDKANVELWNSKGLNVLSPRDVALQYVSLALGAEARGSNWNKGPRDLLMRLTDCSFLAARD